MASPWGICGAAASQQGLGRPFHASSSCGLWVPGAGNTVLPPLLLPPPHSCQGFAREQNLPVMPLGILQTQTYTSKADLISLPEPTLMLLETTGLRVNTKGWALSSLTAIFLSQRRPVSLVGSSSSTDFQDLPPQQHRQILYHLCFIACLDDDDKLRCW